MAIAEQQVTVGVCDACQARRHGIHGIPGSRDPDGYAGTVTYTAGGQTSDQVAWFACRRTHIGPAARGALDAAGALP